MEEFILPQIEDLPTDQVIDLDLQDFKSESLTISDKLCLEQFYNLESLSFNSTGLNSLTHFPKLENLIRLELNDNEIKSGLNEILTSQELMQICLKNNKIDSFDELNHLKSLKSLVYIDLFGCPIANVKDYRDKLFEMIPCLQIVDGINRDGIEMSLSDIDSEDSLDEGDQDDSESQDDDDSSVGSLQECEDNVPKLRKK